MHQNWSQVSEVGPWSRILHMGPFYSLLVAIYKHAKLWAGHHNLWAEGRSSTCLITPQSPCLQSRVEEEKNCSCDNVKQCVLTIGQSRARSVEQREQPVGGSANILWLLLSAAPLCTLFPSFSAISTDSVSKACSLSLSAEAVGTINALLRL